MYHAICLEGEGEGGCFSPEFISRYGTNQLIHSGACKRGAEACKQHFIRYGILKKKRICSARFISTLLCLQSVSGRQDG